jgi:hypothetical protein
VHRPCVRPHWNRLLPAGPGRGSPIRTVQQGRERVPPADGVGFRARKSITACDVEGVLVVIRRQ